ncbi:MULTISPECIES: hypothetical protein [Paracoccus]|jgi:uncharacterized BrkB/YihY/UPF0761 family membrane protein|uniref:hypothetical protein n=1 Tax=Paracoccus TaxID=265 RepID=UPI0000555523|nr:MULTISPECIES: hypothetical protein [Paracoccus]MBB4630127.1 uncharacterized BrkB/YihY/UPF0761 family membrane protein [Paracoccus denitrificans]MCU7431462.1 hypothetical protein [Paracoccus denitrificans]MDK8875459.1 hypothetical protein [Paracoccus sp. SSJ]QAR28119.1 hypothetical protein EO213_17480 [Paracoccus denitrificans]UFS67470.1 hypothetical protein LO749_15325 [Paracoccus denitrificans]
MTLDHDHDWLARLLGALIWFVMSLALSVEVCALIGWAFGHAERGGAIGALLNCLFWLWVLWDGTQDRR